LAGADAPEYPKGCLSLKAKERLAELVLGKKVKIEQIEEDSFTRKIGFVKVDGLLIDKTLIEEGLAKATSGEHPQYGVMVLEAQDSAKLAKRGIWSSQCVGGEDCVIKGNYRRDKDTKIYHLPECFNYERIVINEREGDRWFCTEQKAKAAGFRKSEDCP
jgi:endonuclease YncB( thermonuclease family)